jgi:hypothetical protein
MELSGEIRTPDFEDRKTEKCRFFNRRVRKKQNA